MGTDSEALDEGVFISNIETTGTVSRHGKMFVGQRILEVNGTSYLGATHQEAVKQLRALTDKLNIMVCDGFDADEVAAKFPEFMSRSGSVSSVDKEDEDSLISQRVSQGQEGSRIKIVDSMPDNVLNLV